MFQLEIVAIGTLLGYLTNVPTSVLVIFGHFGHFWSFLVIFGHLKCQDLVSSSKVFSEQEHIISLKRRVLKSLLVSRDDIIYYIT